MTGSIEFGQALEIILAQTSTARRLASIKVVRPAQEARLVFDSSNRKKIGLSDFGEAGETRNFQMRIEAELPGFAVWCIADDLNEIADGKPISAIEQRMAQMRADPGDRWLRFFRGERRS
ncbi:hypothetical protein IVB45_22735 [Bradyrhizobium sp. 4]|uniref:hypothetical protein n=1 Tax=unclassified Bradyrhizobium TaxID=2631580 RepID=UPI001FF9A82E|nr:MULTISPECIES: hypothetical protein [unclassified Bradyrhizobium]MCK1402718.1 hypothetical protein [Bradyrhizobium sp. 39]MCK1748313.1 hypothetical protein [Bradyrhizobium sp. 135]UPJ32789.1 hypothetical protein IVB45_22735 [Bradyrhizobium sp. 4]